ncbi:MAG: hypothetical protein HY237_04035 [Acidobacteria bacterium]|nr:hypothetical protein [Acidobacteriota bacterium]
MAEEQHKTEGGSAALATVVAVAGWLVPGLGHLLLRKWTRALVYFLAVGTLAVTGLALRGNIFSALGGDAFDMLGFLADLGTGVFYLVSRIIENGGPDVSRAAGDYGTRLFATAGVLNLLCVLDAHEIARGRKT